MTRLAEIIGDIVSGQHPNYGIGTSNNKENLILIRGGLVLGVITIDGQFHQSPGNLMNKEDCLVVWKTTDLAITYSLIIQRR